MKKFSWLYKNKPEKIFDGYIENWAKVQNPNINDKLQSALNMDTRLAWDAARYLLTMKCWLRFYKNYK